jgi:hypothetical protein
MNGRGSPPRRRLQPLKDTQFAPEPRSRTNLRRRASRCEQSVPAGPLNRYTPLRIKFPSLRGASLTNRKLSRCRKELAAMCAEVDIPRTPPTSLVGHSVEKQIHRY